MANQINAKSSRKDLFGMYYPVKGDVKISNNEINSDNSDVSVKVVEFVMGYWFEKVKFNGEKKERFRFIPEDSKVRVTYEEILRVYDLDMKYCRFYNVGEKFKVSESSGSNSKGSDNIMVFYGLKQKVVQKNQQKFDNELVKGIDIYRNVA